MITKSEFFQLLDQYPWQSLKCIVGNCGALNFAVHELVSDEHERAEKGYWKLDNHVVVQGGLFEASFYMLPFILKIIKEEWASNMSIVYELLYEISNGASSDVIKFTRVSHHGFTYFMPSSIGNEEKLDSCCRKFVAENIDLIVKDSIRGIEEATEILETLEEFPELVIASVNQIVSNQDTPETTRKLATEISKDFI